MNMIDLDLKKWIARSEVRFKANCKEVAVRKCRFPLRAEKRALISFRGERFVRGLIKIYGKWKEVEHRQYINFRKGYHLFNKTHDWRI
jgi:hypothetical protein